MKTLRRLTLAIVALLAGAALMTSAAHAQDGWIENYQQALQQAKQQNKMVLMDFTGSDWCPWCIKLHDEVFATPAFKSYAEKNLILVKVDFPQGIKQSAELKAQNDKLQKQYGIEGYPTVIVLNPNGKKVGELGYQPGGPQPFITRLSKLK